MNAAGGGVTGILPTAGSDILTVGDVLMIRYILAALALKAFSLNAPTRALYRKIGNTFGAKARHEVSDLGVRVERGDLLVALARKYDAIAPGAAVLEIGTGWMHWYGLYLRLFWDLRVTAFDVWDNRQYSALQAGFAKLAPVLQKRGVSADVQRNLSIIDDATGFEDLYNKLGIEYVIQPTGSIAEFEPASFDAIFSMHVLEHVPARNVRELVENMFRKLKPAGYTIHQIGIDDHLAHYDRAASPKQYIEYSDRIWKLLFQNEVQYFNRLQMSEWLGAFERAGFELQEKLVERTGIESLTIDPRFAGYDTADLSCTILTLVYRKPS
jgi:SAM-dependent methyltransferase